MFTIVRLLPREHHLLKSFLCPLAELLCVSLFKFIFRYFILLVAIISNPYF